MPLCQYNKEISELETLVESKVSKLYAFSLSTLIEMRPDLPRSERCLLFLSIAYIDLGRTGKRIGAV
jgi:hypothetical protein